MLEPREADLLFLFLFLVVLPVVAYFFLGKWSEASKKRERINLLAQLAAEETLRAETMAIAKVNSHVSTLKNGIHVCARCYRPSTTRCSRCKSVRYCSGKCQIMHWREVHKQECHQLDSISSCSSPRASFTGNSNSLFFGYNEQKTSVDNEFTEDAVDTPIECVAPVSVGHFAPDISQNASLIRSKIGKRPSRKSGREVSRRQDVSVLDFWEEAVGSKARNSSLYNNTSIGHGSLHPEKDVTTSLQIGAELRSAEGNSLHVENTFSGVKEERRHSFETTAIKGSRKAKEPDQMRDFADSGSNGFSNISFKKMMTLRESSKLSRQETAEFSAEHKKMKTLFPYNEFVRIFNCQSINLLPRGLLNCGNSCYANAVLQCLTSTKPLTFFLLHRTHSKSCFGKNWCLMCELEHHVMMLRERGGPLSPGRILVHMRNINCQIGDGSQEDAHEFLRLLVASMQSICLEGLGGENNVDPRLQETTFIQHTFGGRLSSKVKCLRCHRESERYESIMDLTLEIFGWVESLEDALSQFTAPEELDGENMYRCGRCASYVRARKQLRIHEAPNILTIVLKRFQEGQYGKINKCITFPEVLDMVPFMTGSSDVPPLYMLYAVVVHLDTLNASFSGHYVAYVKDLQGSWLRIDDTEIHPVPMSQVMSEGAYILFYMRSCPRPQSSFFEKVIQQQFSASSRRSQKPSKHTQSKSNSHFLYPHPSLDLKPEYGTGLPDGTDGRLRRVANRNIAQLDFTDATCSDWSMFTSSDEASFTTESTRDSFSTVDYADTSNGDTLSSVFNNLYAPESSMNTICSRKFSTCRPQTGFISEERGNILDSYLSTQPPKKAWKGLNLEKVSHSGANLTTDNYSSKSVKSGSNPRSNVDQTSHRIWVAG